MTLVMNQLPSEGQSTLSQVQAADCALKKATSGAVLVANNFVMNLVGVLFPRPMAAKALYSGQCTSGFSNMPGPEKQISLFGRPLQKIMFWVPHKGITGMILFLSFINYDHIRQPHGRHNNFQ
jgi:hypothetical protein